LGDAVDGNVFVDNANDKDHEGGKKNPERNPILGVINFHDAQTEKVQSETDRITENRD
jgi:hypothetical protein